MSWNRIVAAGIAVLVIAFGPCRCRTSHVTRIATFNIETFPKHEAQVAGAFDAIAALDADAIAVQEILEPERFARAARDRLGEAWQFVHVETMPEGSRFRVHVGVLFDTRRLTLASTAVHDDTRIDGRHKPVFEVRLAPRDGAPVVQIFVVHFKSGSEYRSLRAQQFRALGAILVRARRPGERIAVLGDFNATDDRGDRDDLATLARRTDLAWRTQALACTAFWDRDDGCFPSRLDHVLASSPGDATAHAACSDGCPVRDRCPRYADEVSDHCPVSIDLP